jgi:hypothetical protein
MMATAPPSLEAILGRHEDQLADHDARLSALEANALSPAAANGEEVA